MPFTYLPKESVTLCTKVARIFWLSFQTCAYDSGAVMITKLESFETSLQQIESIMGKSKFTEVRKYTG